MQKREKQYKISRAEVAIIIKKLRVRFFQALLRINFSLKTVFFGFFFAFFSCQMAEPIEKPEISREKFIEAIAYFALLEGSYNVSLIREQNGLEILASNYRFAFDSLGFSLDQFEKTYNYYLDNPNEMANIFDEALSLLNARKAQIDSNLKQFN